MRLTSILGIASLIFAPLGIMPCLAQEKLSTDETQVIAEEAFIYALPMVMAYDVIHEYAIDKHSSQYKAPFNQLYNEARVFTPKDTAVVTPNSDTPYSFVSLDLRAEPIVLCVPDVEKGRYYSVQLTSLYTFNFGYIGSRATGNQAGCYAVVGPNWTGDVPAGVNKIFRSETDFAIAIYRTQLFNPSDMENVKKIQAEYKVLPLSKFLNKPVPAPAPVIKWPEIDKSLGLAKGKYFDYLNFLLQFAPPIGSAAVEKPLRARFAKIGIEAGKPFSSDQLTTEQKKAIETATKNALAKIKQEVATIGQNENGWRVATTGFGDREALKGNWTMRAAAAVAGIFGNDAVEALYPLAKVDSDGLPLDGSQHSYTLTFAADQLPPVNAFWSVTMYDGKTQLLIENPINRYLINSPMLPDLKKNPDGSITLYIQKNSPGKDKESNWLPAPNGPIYMVMRLYWPKETALNGTWEPPAVRRTH